MLGSARARGNLPWCCHSTSKTSLLERVQDKQIRLGWTVNSPRGSWRSNTGMDIFQNMLPAMGWLALIALSTEAYVLV
jgi:hypothetical protein